MSAQPSAFTGYDQRAFQLKARTLACNVLVSALLIRQFGLCHRPHFYAEVYAKPNSAQPAAKCERRLRRWLQAFAIGVLQPKGRPSTWPVGLQPLHGHRLALVNLCLCEKYYALSFDLCPLPAAFPLKYFIVQCCYNTLALQFLTRRAAIWEPNPQSATGHRS